MNSLDRTKYIGTVDWMSIDLPNSTPQESLTDIANQTFKLAANRKRARENDETDYAAKRFRNNPTEIRYDALAETLSDILQSDYEAHREQHLAENQRNFQDWTKQMDQLKALKKQREECPVTKKAIELQAQLMRAKREGRYFAGAMTQEELSEMVEEEDVNLVHQIMSSSGEINPVAFVKIGPKDHENNPGIMEKLMWDIALIMGLEEVFVPTGLVYLSTEKYPDQGFFAGIQPAQSGITSDDYLLGGRPIEKNNFLRASLATLLFGMFDVHGDNIIIDQEGKVHFFDNTRSLSHTNGFIKRYDNTFYWVSPYRSALLMFPESYKPLTKESFTEITHWLKKWWSRMPMLEKYLKSKTVKASLSKLPAHWFDVDQVLFAMKKRLLTLQECVQKESQKSILDLVNQVFPKYRLAYALTLAEALITRSDEFSSDLEYDCRLLHRRVGYTPVDELARDISHVGYSVKKVRSVAMDPNLSWNQMCQEIQSLTQKIPCHDSRHISRMKTEVKDLIVQYVSPGSRLDIKDFYEEPT